METKSDVAIVGGGILGIANAWAAAKRGLRVTLFERSLQAKGASVRNFGAIWPIGQPAGPLYEIAMESRTLWIEAAQEADCWLNPCGSLHLAFRDEERAVIQEFLNSPFGRESGAQWISSAETMKRSPASRNDGLLGALDSPNELAVDPRQMTVRLPRWLQDRRQVEICYGAPVVRVTANELYVATGRRHRADRIVVCGGHETRQLYPDWFAQQQLYECKLQMMRTAPQPKGWRIGPHLAGGLTLQHYPPFRDCPSLPSLRRRIAEETPELNNYGIHVLASQNERGEVILGDSHEYGDHAVPFDSPEIDRLILREIGRLIDLPDWTIAERWHGIYVKHAELTLLHEMVDGVSVLLAPGGAGMTLSLGIAERMWRDGFAEVRL